MKRTVLISLDVNSYSDDDACDLVSGWLNLANDNVVSDGKASFHPYCGKVVCVEPCYEKDNDGQTVIYTNEYEVEVEDMIG